MKVVMTMPIRNEEDILDYCLEFHLNREIDHIIALNNLSDDGSVEILEKYAARGNVTLLSCSQDNYDQIGWVSQMTQIAVEMGADWIIHNDADEFWWSEDLKKVLNSIPTNEYAAAVDRYNFVPVDEHPWIKTHIYKDLESLNTFGRRILPKVCHRPKIGLQLKTGNHKALLHGKVIQPYSISSNEIEIWHFPIRGFQQFEKKVKIGGQAYSNNPALWPKTPVLELFRLHKEGKLQEYYKEQLITSLENKIRLEKGKICKEDRLYKIFEPSFRNCLS